MSDYLYVLRPGATTESHQIGMITADLPVDQLERFGLTGGVRALCEQLLTENQEERLRDGDMVVGFKVVGVELQRIFGKPVVHSESTREHTP